MDLEIDAELPFEDIDTKFLKDLEKLAPFGPGNKKPLFLSRGVQPRGEPKKRGKDTMQCFLTDRNGRVTCEAVGFRTFERWRRAEHKGAIDIVHQPSLLDYKGIISVQLELEDWAPSR
jgi:single-stranded-DNA-specific exonuclease